MVKVFHGVVRVGTVVPELTVAQVLAQRRCVASKRSAAVFHVRFMVEEAALWVVTGHDVTGLRLEAGEV